MSWMRALRMLSAAGMASAAAGALAVAPAAAGAGEAGAGSGASCPTSNPPNTMTLVAGTPQTATLHSAYATALQVALTNTNGCAVTSGAAGVAVTFTAPSGGASGLFSASGGSAVTVGADSTGAVMASTFTANGIAGGYTITASSQYGSVSFALTNVAAGVPARILAVSPRRQTATVARGYAHALAVRVLDGDGNPVAGASVEFTLAGASGSGACGTSSGSPASGTGSAADASFAGGVAEATATSTASGIATSPRFTADGDAGSFTASADLASANSSESSGRGGGGSSSATPVMFTLTNVAGRPAKLTPGVGATQSARVGTRFPVGLAVTVTDAQGNRVPHRLVSFAAPAAGPSGRFATRSASRARRRSARARQTSVARVRTNACGVAVAPPFTADGEPGGYIVKASVAHARAAAFALVNEAP